MPLISPSCSKTNGRGCHPIPRLTSPHSQVCRKCPLGCSAHKIIIAILFFYIDNSGRKHDTYSPSVYIDFCVPSRYHNNAIEVCSIAKKRASCARLGRLFYRRFYQSQEQRMWSIGPGFIFRMELAAHKPGMPWYLNDFHQISDQEIVRIFSCHSFPVPGDTGC